MYRMKTYKVAMVRERLAEALDEAERGMPVFIERKGVRYRLTMEKPGRSRVTGRRPKIETLDAAVAEGQWSWETGPTGLRFRDGSRR
jgi:hypothetical protein